MTSLQRRFAVAAASLALLALGHGSSLVAAQPREKVIKVVAKRFDYSPAHLTLKKGQPVVLELSTRDVLMGFNAPDFNVRADIVPGKTALMTFTPDKAGTFAFLCDVFCGDGHETMSGTLVVA